MPLEKGDHPELDDTELLDKSGIEQYQSLLGSLQWAISLGCFDSATVNKNAHSVWLFNQYILGVSILVLEYYFGIGYIFGG